MLDSKKPGLLDLISVDAVHTEVNFDSKKSLLLHAAESLSELCEGVSKDVIFQALHKREKLNSTGIGRGVGLPHARIKNLDGIYATFYRLSNPIEFDSTDGKAVDIVVCLIAPDHAGSDHLQALARLARNLRTADFANLIRNAKDKDALMALFAQEGN